MEYVTAPVDCTQIYEGSGRSDPCEPVAANHFAPPARSAVGDARRNGYSMSEPSRGSVARRAGQKNRKGLLGLSNLGNTCFMNSALQCLTHTHGLQKYFRYCSHAYTSKSQSSRQKLLMALAHWFERDWAKNVSAPYHVPEDILRSVQQLNPMFSGFQQHDSQEFLRCVLDNMHEELRREVPDDLDEYLGRYFQSEGATTSCSSTAPAERASGAKAAEGSSTSGASTDAEPKTHFSSIVSEIFQGRMVSKVKCLACKNISKTVEVAYDVSVPIPNPNEVHGGGDCSPHDGGGPRGGSSNPWWSGVLGGVSGKVKNWFYDKGVELTDCFRKHCAPELLTGKDQYFCEKCKRKNDCEKTIAFKELPEVLCVHLKRFRYDAGWFNGTKNSKVVNFPVNRPLDMSSFLETAPPHPVEYKLIGLIQHIGAMGGGHYIAYCQHKRKPQEWFEFDDLHVSLASHDQVERAEPYVLLYQRLPSKGNTLDRQKFKTDQRQVQAQIKTHLLNHPSTLLASRAARSVSEELRHGEIATAASAAQQAQQAVADEMRLNGPAVRNLYRSPPSELELAFVSKHWYVRLTTLSKPGPLDNFEYLCPHGLLGSHSVEMAAEPFIPISRQLFDAFSQKYGGGPLISSLDICPRCQAHLRAYNDRKQAEFDLVQKYDTKDTCDGKYWYLVDALWVNRWKRYVRGEHVTDIRDMCAPGEITNTRLLDKDDPTKFRANLRLRSDYIGVNARVWWLFMHVHGGGPAICCEDLDIYSARAEPETELVPDELRAPPGCSAGAREYVRRTSRQFVDECKGDLAECERRFPALVESSAEDADHRRLASDRDRERDGERSGGNSPSAAASAAAPREPRGSRGAASAAADGAAAAKVAPDVNDGV